MPIFSEKFVNLRRFAQKSKNNYYCLCPIQDSNLDQMSRSVSFIEKFEHRDERNIKNLMLVFMELVQDQVVKRGVATMDLVMKVIHTRVWVIYEWPFLSLHALKIRKV